MEVGKIEVWCNIESYLGIINAYEIATADPRIVALALGAEDYTASMGSLRSKAGHEIFYARMQVLQSCRLAGISAQDAVFSDFNDATIRVCELAKEVNETCMHNLRIGDIIHDTEWKYS